MPDVARYDGHADWYDETFSAPYAEDPSVIDAFLGRGDGRACVEVACGAARHAPLVAKAGYQFVGIDISRDQLRRARLRSDAVAQGNAAQLPFRSGSVDVALGLYFHTDVEDFHAVMDEIARCLAVGGRLLYIGLHPCFIGGFVDRTLEVEDESLTFVPGYGESGWTRRGSGGGTGLWARVGGHQKTLADLIGAFVEAGLVVTQLLEMWGGGSVLPRNIALTVRKG